jgi:hypothetical protein
MRFSANNPLSFEASCSLHKYLYSRRRFASFGKCGQGRCLGPEGNRPQRRVKFKADGGIAVQGFKNALCFQHALFYYGDLALLAIEIAIVAFNAVLKSQAIGS